MVVFRVSQLLLDYSPAASLTKLMNGAKLLELMFDYNIRYPPVQPDVNPYSCVPPEQFEAVVPLQIHPPASLPSRSN
jgi:hypothetical protein